GEGCAEAAGAAGLAAGTAFGRGTGGFWTTGFVGAAFTALIGTVGGTAGAGAGFAPGDCIVGAFRGGRCSTGGAWGVIPRGGVRTMSGEVTSLRADDGGSFFSAAIGALSDAAFDGAF